MQNNTTIRSKKTRPSGAVTERIRSGTGEKEQTKTGKETQEER